MNKFFITLCDGIYEDNRNKLNNLAKNSNCETISYKLSDLDEKYLEEIKNILKIKRGLGLCAWKPYIILKTFEKIEYGDYVIYLDSADMVHPYFFSYVDEQIRDKEILLVPSPNRNIQKNWTKRDCFVLMNCDSENYWNTVQIEAGLIVAKKTENSIKILKEWETFCKNENILTDVENICGKENFPNFVTHRHDQSIMTNLSVKYDIKQDSNFLSLILHNVV